MMGEIGGCGMGYLFENMEKMDIQAERRNTQREKKRADEAEKENLSLQQFAYKLLNCCIIWISRKQTISKDIDVNFNAWNWKGKEIHGNGKLFL